jgi:hypothetical protein
LRYYHKPVVGYLREGANKLNRIREGVAENNNFKIGNQTGTKNGGSHTTMKRRFCVLLFCFTLLKTTFFGTHVAQAALGESADSVKADRHAFSAQPGAIKVHNGYTVHEIVSDAVSIREYVSPSGVVFAIAWNGLIHPDLTPLLGTYAAEYQKVLQRSPHTPGRRFRQIKTNRIVVEKWGHMRNLQGRAYAVDLIPQGVTINEIK